MKNLKQKRKRRQNEPGQIANKAQFVEAVQFLVPGNKFIAEAARQVPQDMLPAIAGVAALEFASTLDLLCKSWRLRRPLAPVPGHRRRRRGVALRRMEDGGSDGRPGKG
jgi:hypothetical protein